MELNAGAWNIADYAGGNNRLAIALPPDRPLTIRGECLGWSGAELVDLGSFVRTHEPEEWASGRELSAGPSSGRFTVTYRIQPPLERPPEDVPRFEVDPSIPPPYHLALTGVCAAAPGGDCPPGGLQWRWLPRPDDPRPLARFIVFLVDSTPGSPQALMPSYSTRSYWAPLEVTESCVVNLSRTPGGPSASPAAEDLVVVRDVSYVVEAQLFDPTTGLFYESVPSEPAHWSPDCPESVLAMTFTSIGYDPNWASESSAVSGPDCNAIDAYGDIAVRAADGRILAQLLWNCPNCGRPDLLRSFSPFLQGAPPPHDTQVGCTGHPDPAAVPPGSRLAADQSIDLATETLNKGVPGRGWTGYAYNNNTVLVPLSEPAMRLYVTWNFHNASGGGLGVSDPGWCSWPGFPAGGWGWSGTPWIDRDPDWYISGTGVVDHLCWLNVHHHVLETH
jgi:hypothetical protein